MISAARALRLRQTLNGSAPVRDAVTRVLDALNGQVGEPRLFDRLDELLGAQSYRLASWQVASEEMRF